MTDLTPEQIARIRHIAASGDPYMRGAIWMHDLLTQPSPTAGVSSSQEQQS